MSKALTVEEVAERLRVKPITVREYLRKGKIPGRRVGKSWLVIDVDLENFLSSQPQAETSAQERWRALSIEERSRRMNRIRGMLSGGRHTVDDFMREKHEEVLEEESRWEGRDSSVKTPPEGDRAA